MNGAQRAPPSVAEFASALISVYSPGLCWFVCVCVCLPLVLESVHLSVCCLHSPLSHCLSLSLSVTGPASACLSNCLFSRVRCPHTSLLSPQSVSLNLAPVTAVSLSLKDCLWASLSLSLSSPRLPHFVGLSCLPAYGLLRGLVCLSRLLSCLSL